MKRLHSWLAALLLSGASVALVNAAPVDINAASAAEIAAAIKGIGPKKAAAIVDYREQHGPFKSLAELEKVPGIGAKLVDANRQDLLLGPAPTAVTPAMPPAAPTSSDTAAKP